MKKYLLVEGRSDVAFITQFTKFLGYKLDEDFRIIDMKGKGGLAKNIVSLEPEFQKNNKVAVILDADDDVIKRREEAEAILVGKEIPLFLMPDDSSTGELETLLLSTIDEHVVLTCFDEYISCLEREGIDSSSVDEKAKLYAYTKLTQDVAPDRSFVTEIWDFKHANFYPLATFLQHFLSDAV